MLGPEVIKDIQRLLAEGDLSQRKIAKAMKVSRGTVAAVSGGKRRPHYPRPEEADEHLTGPVRRCGGCGSMAAMPCRACRIRRLKSQSPKPDRLDTRNVPLRLDLADKDRIRYEEIRRQRMRAAD